MAENIFDIFDRTDENHLNGIESLYHFYNRCAWQSMENVRQLIQECLNNYPNSEQNELIKRLQSNDDTQFKSACFELLIHQILILDGCTLTPHPELPNGNFKKPDFLVKAPEGDEYYLEARLIKDLRETSEQALNRKNEVLNILNRRPHRDYMIWLDENGEPNSQPSAKNLIKTIHDWLDKQDRGKVLEAYENMSKDIPLLEIELDGWYLKIKPIPVKEKARGNIRSFIGTKGTGVAVLNVANALRKGIRKKSSRYGEFDKPYLIAINAIDVMHIHRIDEMNALFGSEQVNAVETAAGIEHSFGRADDGVFYLKYKPSHTRISGIWIFRKLMAPDIVKTDHTIYFHPFSEKPLPKSLSKYPHVKLDDDGKFISKGGLSLQNIWDLSNNWPN
ncbi:MAG: hypothetical protein OCD03_11620 [Hyphomicrobiales bacterium]